MKPWIPTLEQQAWILSKFEYRDGRIVRLPDGTPRSTWIMRSGYVMTSMTCVSLGIRHDVYVHRLMWFLVTKEWPTLQIDHINRDKQDNRFENLRIATSSENKGNQVKHDSRAGRAFTSRYKGVCWSRDRSRWIAQISIEGKTRRLGRFEDEKEAACAYNRAAQAYFGEFAVLNLLEEE